MVLGGPKVKEDKKLATFLKKNPFAKIVIIVDTHSSQDGQIVTRIAKNSVYSDILGKVSANF